MLLTANHAVFVRHQASIGEYASRRFQSMPACFFWVDWFLLASYSKRTLLYITYNIRAERNHGEWMERQLAALSFREYRLWTLAAISSHQRPLSPSGSTPLNFRMQADWHLDL